MGVAALNQDEPELARPLPALLDTLASELEVVRSLGERVESAICAAQRHTHSDAQTVEDLQQIDLMLQQLSALRDFLKAVASTGALDSHVQIAAGLARITLAEMKSRLSGASVSGAAPGELDMW
ncbi:MAG: hypothetical protein GC189_08700 [Alphaproteobacteria bacterium]|nr:hypothetical protein [Alphaproteobacteria bacterium]